MVNATKKCMRCHKSLYQHVEKCGCGSYDFFPDEQPLPQEEKKSKIYVLMPDGTKDYINEKVIRWLNPKVGCTTAAGYPIMEDICV